MNVWSCAIIFLKQFNVNLFPFPNPQIPFRAAVWMKITVPILLGLFLHAADRSVCCCPSSVYRDHYVSAKADERETHIDHKRRQTSPSDPLIIADSFINMPFSCRSNVRNMKRENDRRVYTQHTHVRPHGRKKKIIILTLEIISISPCDTLDSFYFSNYPAQKIFSPTFRGLTVDKLVTKHRHSKSCKLSHTPTPPPRLFSFACSSLRRAMLFSHPLFDPFHTSPPLLYLLLFSPFTGKQRESSQ